MHYMLQHDKCRKSEVCRPKLCAGRLHQNWVSLRMSHHDVSTGAPCYTAELHGKKLRVVKNRIEQCCAILFNVVNNIVQHCYTWLQAGFRLNNLFSIVDNIEQCGQHNIVQSCFQQPSTTHNFYACTALHSFPILWRNHFLQHDWGYTNATNTLLSKSLFHFTWRHLRSCIIANHSDLAISSTKYIVYKVYKYFQTSCVL